jgi:hypothetical protein
MHTQSGDFEGGKGQVQGGSAQSKVAATRWGSGPERRTSHLNRTPISNATGAVNGTLPMAG